MSALKASTRSVCQRREAAAFSRPCPSSVTRTVSSRRSPAPFTSAAPRRSSVAIVPAAAAAAQSTSSSPAATKEEYYALVANAEFFFNDVQNESMAEQMRERVRFFQEQNKERDFWLVPEPKWLDAKYPQQAKQVKRPCVALVGTDKQWIIFMKLRLDRVMRIDLTGMSKEEALAVGGKVPEFSKQPKWTAPYPAYSPGWWEVFEPKNK